MKFKITYDVTARLDFDVEADSIDQALELADEMFNTSNVPPLEVRSLGTIRVFDANGEIVEMI